MEKEWDNTIPIYKQLETMLIKGILTEDYKEGDPLPSVRQLSIDLQINHLTVAKAYQELVEHNIIEKRRGIGMFVQTGALSRLDNIEKEKFFDHELPQIVNRMATLKISNNDMLSAIEALQNNTESKDDQHH